MHGDFFLFDRAVFADRFASVGEALCPGPWSRRNAGVTRGSINPDENVIVQAFTVVRRWRLIKDFEPECRYELDEALAEILRLGLPSTYALRGFGHAAFRGRATFAIFTETIDGIEGVAPA